jgi:predicted Rossmann fold flavoprotein
LAELSSDSFDAIILGAGAAGLLCAIEAGKRGRRVALFDHADRIGKKILISGGGRCNFTNIHCTPENFISANPHFAKSALARYTPDDFITLVKKHRITFHEKTLGQLFCDRSAQEIVTLLEEECRAANVEIFLNSKVREVRCSTNAEHSQMFTIITESGEFRAKSLVVATGGLSIPKLGATSFGYDLARQFSLKIIEPKPALVPLVFATKDHANYCDLTGLSAEVIASTGKQSFREKMLITHRGLSGPAILQISSYWNPGESIRIDLAPDHDATKPIRNTNVRNIAIARAAFHKLLPSRMATRWLELNAPQTWTNKDLADLEQRAHEWKITPAGTEGYEKAEVTSGGVDTGELSGKTMECRKVPGLYFIGEVVDVTGQLGGFNFQWAWASGAAAGRAI